MSLSGDSTLPWSAEQQEWLSALGYTVFASGTLVMEAEAEAPAVEVAPTRVASEAPAHVARARAPQMDNDDAKPATASAPRPAPTRPRAGARLPDRLHFALIRASGLNPNAEGSAEIFAQWPSSAELRGNPAAKRALWPRLRALRKQPQ